MLIWRVVTALILIPFAVWTIFLAREDIFYFIFLGIMLLGANEWTTLSKFDSFFKKGLFFTILIALIFLAAKLPAKGLLWLGTIFWIIPLYLCITFKGQTPKVLTFSWVKAILGWIVLLCAFHSMILLRAFPHYSWQILWLFLLIWASDIGAYFAGRSFGKRPLAQHVSPKKTLEGVLGGLLAAFLVALYAYYKMFPHWEWFAIAFITVLLGILGDLFESLMKRIANVKDSGKLLPGHGGVLDRLDSLIAALPFYTLSMSMMMGLYS